MTADILAVLRKEWIEILHMRGSAKATFAMMTVPILILGIIFPLQFGKQWALSPVSLIAWAWIPLLIATAVVADSFAGEKERHTLETLLASRLPDRAILFGKLLGSVSYALGMTLAVIIVGLVTINVRYAGGGIILPDGRYFLAGSALGLLGTTFITAIGILVSLRARTVRQAQQTMSFFVIFIGVLPGLLMGVIPRSIRNQAFSAMKTVSGADAFLIVLAALAVFDVLLVAAALRRFKRDKLVSE